MGLYKPRRHAIGSKGKSIGVNLMLVIGRCRQLYDDGDLQERF